MQTGHIRHIYIKVNYRKHLESSTAFINFEKGFDREHRNFVWCILDVSYLLKCLKLIPFLLPVLLKSTLLPATILLLILGIFDSLVLYKCLYQIIVSAVCAPVCFFISSFLTLSFRDIPTVLRIVSIPLVFQFNVTSAVHHTFVYTSFAVIRYLFAKLICKRIYNTCNSM